MTTLNLTPLSPSIVTNLIVTSAVGGASLKWDITSDVKDKFEVWYNTSNDSSTATKIATVDANHYILTNLSISTNYWVWVRTLNQYGITGPFSSINPNWSIGSNFANLTLGVHVSNVVSTTTSIDSMQAQIWYSNISGSANVGPSYFTSTVTQNTSGTTPWANVGNARVNDGNFATVTTNNSYDILYTLADIAIPADAIISGIQFTVNGKTDNYIDNKLGAYILNGTVAVGTGFAFNKFTANNTIQNQTVGSSITDWNLDGGGAAITQQLISSSNTTSIGNIVTSGTSFGTGSSSPSVTVYGTWYSCGYASFTAASNDYVTVSQYLISTISSITSTGTDRLNVYVRDRLYDTTLSLDVPGGAPQYLIFQTVGVSTYGNLVNINNFNRSFISGFRGLLVPGHSYAVYREIMKEQSSGTPTCSITVNSSGSFGSAATLP